MDDSYSVLCVFLFTGLVPDLYKNDDHSVALGKWVQSMRQCYQGRGNRSLTSEEIRMLNALGFVWEVFDAHWFAMFDKLLEYKAANGHCEFSHIP
jgi:hypothetical protein